LPAPGVMVRLSPEFNPPILKGIKVHPNNPFRFDFILDQGDEYNRHPERSEGSQKEQLKIESTRLIKYFLASLTIPENDLWVNLSPYEKNRIIPQSFGLTEMGRDLLAEDYMLKQITASLIYPEDTIGKKFWKRIYEEAEMKFGTTNIPVNTFNKVWIVPEKAVVYENAKAGTAYVVEAKLKVMLEQDYLAFEKNTVTQNNTVILSRAKDLNKINSLRDSSAEFTPERFNRGPQNDVNTLGSQIIREIVIPELTKEVNEGKNFIQLRQVYNSLILAAWYKKKIKDSILAQVYADKKKVAGIEYNNSVIPAKGRVDRHSQLLAGIQSRINSDMDPRLRGDDNKKIDVELIYHRYLQAFKKGVFNYIKEEPLSIPALQSKEQGILPRKYFSGGVTLLRVSSAMSVVDNPGQLPDSAMDVKIDLAMQPDSAKLASVPDKAALSKTGRANDNKPPFGEMFDFLERGVSFDFNDIADKNRSLGVQNKRFFEHFEIARKEISSLGTYSDGTISLLRTEEMKYYALLGRPIQGKRKFFEESPVIQLNWLFNMYHELSSWEDMIRIYEEAQRNRRNDFTGDQGNINEYVRALNRSGRSLDAIEFLDKKVPELAAKGEVLTQEIYIGYGTAYKNLWVADRRKTLSLKKAFDNYMKAYEDRDKDSYYAGINVIRILIYQGKEKEAQKLIKLVKESVVRARNKKSFWVVATFLELALLEGSTKEVNEKFIPDLLRLSKRDGELNSLLEHLQRWKLMEKDRDRAKYQLLGQAIEGLETGEKTLGKKETLTEYVERVVVNLGLFLNSIVMPKNLKYGGVVPDTIISDADRTIALAIVDHQLEGGDFIMKNGAIERSLGNITKVEEANQWIDSYIEWIYRIKNKKGIRALEYLDVPEHVNLDEFFKKYKVFAGLDVFGNGSEATTGADNVTMTAMAGRGDCRPSNDFKNLLFDAWNRRQREPLRQEAIKAFKEALQTGEFGQYDQKAQAYLDQDDHQFGVMQVAIYSNTNGNGKYNFLSINDPARGRKYPIKGCGLDVYNDNGRKVVLINKEHLDFLIYKKLGKLQKFTDKSGKFIGYKVPGLEIRSQDDGRDYIYNSGAIDSRYKLAINPKTGQEEVLRLGEEHETCLEILYDKKDRERVIGIKFRDTWYPNADGSGFYRYNTHGVIRAKALEDFYRTGEIHIADGMEVFNPHTGRFEIQDIVMKILPYSDSRRLRTPHRFNPGFIHRGAQRLFNAYNLKDRVRMLKVLFSKEIRKRIDGEVNEEIRTWVPSVKMKVKSVKKKVSNAAMKAGSPEGGIDLTPARMDVQVKTGSSMNVFGDDNGGIKFYLNPAQLAQLQNASGFVPVLVSVRKLTDLRAFLTVP